MSFPNQKIIKIHKENKQKEPFVSLNVQTMTAAYKDLNATAFYLYLCLCCNKDGFQLEFSPANIATNFGMPDSTVRDQFKKLVEKKYLVPIQKGSNIYNFYAEPPHLIEIKAKEKERLQHEAFYF